jgi:hypothetical protein
MILKLIDTVNNTVATYPSTVPKNTVLPYCFYDVVATDFIGQSTIWRDETVLLNVVDDSLADLITLCNTLESSLNSLVKYAIISSNTRFDEVENLYIRSYLVESLKG